MALVHLILGPVMLVLGSIILAYITGYGMRPKDFPPGPPTLPIIGNLHLIPMSNLHLKLQEWAQKYGPIMSLKFGTQDMIVINSDKVTRDLLDKKSGIYSGRMDLFIREFGEDLNILMKSNDEVWRRQRRMYHLRLNANVANKYLPYQHFETTQLLWDLLQAPGQYEKHVKRFTTSLGSTLVYGWRTTSVELPHVKRMFEWADGYGIAAGRLQIMDFWPSLRILFRRAPSWITNISKEMERLKTLEDGLWLRLLNEAKHAIAAGSAKSSFCIDMIMQNDTKSDDVLTEKQLAFNAGHAWAGSADTTLSTTLGFIKAMILFPHVQKQAQDKLDRVVGKDRLPEWADWDALLYIRSVMKETFRWFPAAMLGGMPHCLSRNDIYESYRLPANAGIMLNIWAINNDALRAPEPRTFDPSRFEGDLSSTGESAAMGDATKRDHFSFGAGRRICPGLHVAERSMFITIARLLWAFNFSHATGGDGKPIPIDRDAVRQRIVATPVPFACTIEPRDEKRAELIKSTWENCRRDLDPGGNYTEDFYTRNFGQ